LEQNHEYIEKLLESLLSMKLYDHRNEFQMEFSFYLINSAIESIRQRSNLRPPAPLEFDNDILCKIPKLESDIKEDKSKALKHIASLFNLYTKKNTDTPIMRNAMVNTIINTAKNGIQAFENPQLEREKSEIVVKKQGSLEPPVEKVLSSAINLLSEKLSINRDVMNTILSQNKTQLLELLGQLPANTN